MTLRFGTDGVRGVANADLTPELVVALGRAAARVLGGPVVVGRDTRVSSPMLQAALAAGLAAEGAQVLDLGVIPTPAVAWLAAADGVVGAMISASHNPFPDNGIKFFGPGGRKLCDEEEERLESELDHVLAQGPRQGATAPTGEDVGSLAATAGVDRYVDALISSVEASALRGTKVVLDCAHGAAFEVAPRVLRAVGAEVQAISDAPNGTNINDGCGSTHPELLRRAVLDGGADIGLAFDGDADRVVAIDHRGEVVDGDQILAVCALDLAKRDRLAKNAVVVTVMTNLGFRRAMAEHGIDMVETPVGDRYVLEAIEAGGLSLGGEQSGHVIFRDLATTGDGVLTGLQLLDVMGRTGRSLAELASVMTRLPQVLCNVRVVGQHRLGDAGEVWTEVKEVEAALGEEGRVLVRASGTEPLVRVMVEATTEAQADQAASRLVSAVERALGPA